MAETRIRVAGKADVLVALMVIPMFLVVEAVLNS
jgi:hypothetical protein